MIAFLVKWLPFAAALIFMFTVLLRHGADLRKVLIWCSAGYGLGGALTLAASLSGPDVSYPAMRVLLGLAFIALFVWALLAYYRFSADRAVYEVSTPFISLSAGALAAALFLLRFPLEEGAAIPFIAVAAVGGLAGYAAWFLEKNLSRRLKVNGVALLAAVVGSLLYMAAQSLRLDVFSPLTMKVMKFIHDLVHQAFETLLIPDHPFFRNDIWEYIGFLFGNSVGFWGGLLIWLIPPVLILWMVAREPLPKVSHIRHGAKRRQIVAGHLCDRRIRAGVPLLSLAFFLLAVYRSLSPAVEYWDPKPIKISADAAGNVLIPFRGEEYDLTDGRIHKFLLVGKRPVRFFVLQKPDGRMTVALDACAICKPQGYGQAEGSVICYYCNTLIPLATVGQPGGCNPVPIQSEQAGETMRVSADLLANSWDSTVQAVMRVPEGGR